jgi:hypothetical protein
LAWSFDRSTLKWQPDETIGGAYEFLYGQCMYHRNPYDSGRPNKTRTGKDAHSPPVKATSHCIGDSKAKVFTGLRWKNSYKG